MASQRKGEQRKAEIRTEARAVLLRDGHADLSLRQIAGQVGISVGNLQYYFPTKEDLIEDVIGTEIDRSLAIAVNADWDATHPTESLQKTIQSLLRHHASEAGRFYAIAEALALHNTRFAALKAQGYKRVFDTVEDLVGRMAPHLSKAQAKRLTRVLVALIDGASLQVQFGHVSISTEDLSALADDLARAMAHLLESWS